MMSAPNKGLEVITMLDWSQEAEEADHSTSRFLEYSQQELEDLNRGADEVFKSTPEESSTLPSAFDEKAQSTPIPPKSRTMSSGSGIIKINLVPRSKPQKRNDVTPPSGHKDQKKSKPPTDS